MSQQWAKWIRQDRGCQAHCPLPEFHVSRQKR